MTTKKQAVSVGEYKDAILNVVQIANDPGATRTEMLDALDQIITAAQTVYPDVLEDADEADSDDEADDDDDDEEEAA
jgi:hypothetical protein